MEQLLKNLKVQTAKILSRATAHRDKKAVVFECLNFHKLFEKFSLPCFPENTCHQCHQTFKSNNNSDLRGDKSKEAEKDLSPDNYNDPNIYEVVTSGDKQNQEIRNKDNKTVNRPFVTTPNGNNSSQERRKYEI